MCSYFHHPWDEGKQFTTCCRQLHRRSLPPEGSVGPCLNDSQAFIMEMSHVELYSCHFFPQRNVTGNYEAENMRGKLRERTLPSHLKTAEAQGRPQAGLTSRASKILPSSSVKPHQGLILRFAARHLGEF